VVAIVGVLAAVHARWVADPPYAFTGTSRFGWALAYAVLLAVAAYVVGLPDQPSSLPATVGATVAAAGVAALGVSAVQLAVGDALLPRFVVFGAALALVPLEAALNAVARSGRSREEGRDRVLVVAPAAERARLAEDLGRQPERHAVVVGELDVDDAAGPGRPLVEALGRCGASMVVLDRRAQADDRVIAQAAELHESGVRVRTLSAFYEGWLGKLPLSELERASLFFDIGELHRAWYLRTKRMLDVGLALAGTVVLVVVTPLVVVGDLAGNRGPLLYRQERVGKGGRRFTIFKFRTMDPAVAPRADQGSPSPWTDRDDPRVTPFGRFLRATHLDELPQVLNVLRGDLAVVGPRPEQPRYVEELTEKLPFYELRHLVRPGLTGWAQVKYGYAGDERDALEKLQYEFFYLRHQGLRFDLHIIVRTTRSMVSGPGAGR
jgi:lipopolysaccharide/colanic/teichoic acid biosynthesis glycosyltransferase